MSFQEIAIYLMIAAVGPLLAECIKSRIKAHKKRAQSKKHHPK